MTRAIDSEEEWHLAQINVGRLLAPRGDPRVQAAEELVAITVGSDLM